jgi:hypothetical protein
MTVHAGSVARVPVADTEAVGSGESESACWPGSVAPSKRISESVTTYIHGDGQVRGDTTHV